MTDDARAVVAPRGAIADRGAEGVLWSYDGRDLNANIVAWGAGGGVAEHRGSEVDVVVVVLHGSLTVTVDDEIHTLGEGDVIAIPAGCRRMLTAGLGGVRYVTAHRRRAPLSVTNP